MAPDPRRKLDYSDLQATPNDGKRYELVHGVLLVTPSPSMVHQRVSRRLLRQLQDYFHQRAIGEVFNAPLDVIFTPHDVMEPDLLVVADQSHISMRGIEQPPLLVIEILSPSTRETDLGLKYRRYAELGVQHYWTVDPDTKRVECHRLADGAFRPVAEERGNAPLVHPDWDGLIVDLATLWSPSPFS
jgi:Uma2 family endonuclease